MKRLMKSFSYAFKGIGATLRSEPNFSIHLSVFVMVVAAGAYFRIPPAEWMLIILCSALVFSLEMVNTAIEKLCDHLHPEKHHSIGAVKDVAAGAVFIAAAASVFIGLMIFVPKIFKVLQVLP